MCIRDRSNRRGRARPLLKKNRALLLQRILGAADSILDFAFDLVGFAVCNELGITKNLAGRDLDVALGLLGHAFDTIFIHVEIFPLMHQPTQVSERCVLKRNVAGTTIADTYAR